MITSNSFWTAMLAWLPGFSMAAYGMGRPSWLAATIDPWGNGYDDGGDY